MGWVLIIIFQISFLPQEGVKPPPPQLKKLVIYGFRGEEDCREAGRIAAGRLKVVQRMCLEVS